MIKRIELFIENKFLVKDDRWDAWSIKDIQQFDKEIVVKGRFHSQVPEDIVKEYEIVERLLFYSFFHYPILDEAFSKATRIYELALKLRCKELGLSFSRGTTLQKREEQLKLHSTNKVSDNWEKVRRIRNYFAHPEQYGYLGITLWRSFSQLINIYNQLFISKEDLEKDEAELTNLEKEAIGFKKGLFVLDNSECKYLVFSAIPFELFSTKKDKKSFWTFHPVLTSFPQDGNSDSSSFSSPIFAHCVNLKIENDKMNALDLITGKEISLYKTNKVENIEKYNVHKKLMENSTDTIRELYLKHIDIEMSYASVRFFYEECWGTE